ncbi:MAG: bacteriochlorophyllide a dehydrogenase [Candidatus Hydrogenedentes bacterium]|nr:bacteriochlorophyllide a dehydrogenase [Candidatus Hydrogenedentota bacterium]
MNAKAVVFTDKLKVAFLDVTVPEPGPRDVVVDTRLSWISNGTEGSFLRYERINGETPYRPGGPWPFPIAPGYQSVGVVERVSEDVTDIAPGQWVFGAIGRIEGMYEAGGGHISPKVMDRSQVWPIPEGVPPVAVSGLVLTQVGYNCGTRPPVSMGDVALVIGDGMVGHWAAQTLHWRGAEVILAGRHDDRLARWPEGGRRHRVNTARDDLVAAVRELAPGVHVLVDTVGSLDTVLACHPLMRPDGHIVSAGFNGTNSMLDIQRLRFGELTLHSPSGWAQSRMDNTLALIQAGYLDTESLITHRLPVERAADAWDLILNRRENALGVILEWT